MPDYLLSSHGITKIEDYNLLINYLAEESKLTFEGVVEVITEKFPGVLIHVDINFLRQGVATTEDHAPYSLIKDEIRSKEQYFLINPTYTDEIIIEIEKSRLE
jgi:hypothetical protein